MFHHRNDGELWVRCYLIDPKTIDDLDRAIYWGNKAADHIKQCEAMIERLDAAEREEDRKREERKAKRAAARKAKEEVQKKEQEAAV